MMRSKIIYSRFPKPETIVGSYQMNGEQEGTRHLLRCKSFEDAWESATNGYWLALYVIDMTSDEFQDKHFSIWQGAAISCGEIALSQAVQDYYISAFKQAKRFYRREHNVRPTYDKRRHQNVPFVTLYDQVVGKAADSVAHDDHSSLYCLQLALSPMNSTFCFSDRQRWLSAEIVRRYISLDLIANGELQYRESKITAE